LHLFFFSPLSVLKKIAKPVYYFLLIPGLFQNHYHYKSYKGKKKRENKKKAQPAPINQ